jgi:hypothetical protein
MATSFFTGSSRWRPAGAVVGGGVVGVPFPPGSAHVWLELFVQVQICKRAPFAVLRSATSRHLPDPVLTSVPLATVHFCAPVALQS